ncbi:MAG: sigma-54-dependent Fis family transcriptional regulator [Gammaproteobacteria bacterium]|nr:sigma-54-dependent Fis family transcriptional regulator [Gammaproteobacteria bacterium]
MNKPLALIVDDEPDIRDLLEMTLSRMDIEVKSAATLAEGKQLVEKFPFDLCLSDMRLPDGNGIDLARHIQAVNPTMPVAIITAHGNMEAAIEAMKAGAFDFVSKPIQLPDLRNLVNAALKLRQAPPTQGHNSRQLLGDSPLIYNTRALIAKLARSQAPVYISGESGSGKELVAGLIHEQGARADMPFVPVNCGAIPEALMESEFFGHKKGSFTGATHDKPGLFQAADGGTLFLDEVADLPLHMQVKLLRAIQEKKIRPIGAPQEVPIDVRILSATHKNLSELARDGRFRQDLFYRINVIELHVPSLRERPQDITILAHHILERLAHNNPGTAGITITEGGLQALMQYSFPGNVRELENVLERAITLCENHQITATDLLLGNNPENTAAKLPSQPQASKSPSPAEGVPSTTGLDPYLDNAEKDAILHALEKTRHNKTAAAKLLGISFRALRYRLKKYGID